MATHRDIAPLNIGPNSTFSVADKEFGLGWGYVDAAIINLESKGKLKNSLQQFPFLFTEEMTVHFRIC